VSLVPRGAKHQFEYRGCLPIIAIHHKRTVRGRGIGLVRGRVIMRTGPASPDLINGCYLGQAVMSPKIPYRQTVCNADYPHAIPIPLLRLVQVSQGRAQTSPSVFTGA
jgi:hypothetical protein